MKKIFSLLLVFAIIFSMTAMTVSADSAAIYTVTYTDDNGAAVDLKTLEAGDTVHVNVTLSGITSFQAGEIKYTWDNTVITPLDYQNSQSLVFGDIWFETIANLTAGRNPVLSEDSEVKEGYIRYTPYKSGEPLTISADGITFLDIKFEVLKTGDANFNLTSAQVKEVEGSYDDVTSQAVTSALVIGSTGGDKVEKAVQATVTSYNEKMTGVLFTAVDGSNKGQYVVRFNGAVEAGNVKVGLKVTGVPATNNLTITAENYYGTAATGVLK